MPPDQALEAWTRLRPMLDLDDIWDPEVHRILPLVQRRLREAGAMDPDLPRLHGLARRTWYENQLRIGETVPVIRELEDAGIPTMLLKGMPLALRYYESVAMRPMTDVDVLVPTRRAPDVLKRLARQGWTWDSRFVNRFHHGVGLVGPRGEGLDVHWHLGLPFILDGDEDGSDDDFWNAAEPLQFGGVESRMLAPTDMLLHICVHGGWSDSGAAVRWIADAMTVLRVARDVIEWDRFEDQIGRRRLTLFVSEPLRYLAEVFDAPIPPDVRARIRSMPSTARERGCRRRSIGPVYGEGPMGRARMLSVQWGRTSAKWRRMRALRALPFFLQQAWSLESVWEVPATAVRKASRRVFRPRTTA
jgi:hypothetical protein